MRLYRVHPEGSDRIRPAVRRDGDFVATDDPFDAGEGARASEPQPGERLPGAEMVAPVDPSKIVCLGRTFRKHAEELGNEVPEQPLIFLKPPSAVVGPGDPVVVPPESEDVHHEAELAVVVGRRLRRADAEGAGDAIFGYTCLNDVTARDLQQDDRTFFRGKCFDTFCPIGPCVATAETFSPSGRELVGRVDGDVRQRASLERMRLSPAEAVALVSRYVTLEPGDVIATGTPAGVGAVEPGEAVTVAVDGIGDLTNPVVAE
ncbi:MAG: fumarylacetoacetate hydrolase family protein [Bradymonadaceae bacterium]